MQTLRGAGKVALFGKIAEVFNELYFETCGINKKAQRLRVLVLTEFRY